MSLRPPSLRAIAAFEAAARHESFAKAADELNLTQSAISHSIRGLEDRLGSRLFVRRGRNVILSEDGRGLAERLRLSLLLLSQALDGMGAAEHAHSLIIGAPNAFASRGLIRRCRSLLRSLPAVRLEVRTDLGVRAVQAGEADLCVDYGVGAYPGLASRVLARDSIVPVAAPDLAVDPDQLSQCDLIENVDQSWTLWFAQCSEAQPARAPWLTVRDWSLAIDAARAGLGVCLAPESLVAEELRRGDLVRAGKSIPSVNAYHLVWRTHGPKATLVGRVLEILQAEAPADSDVPGEPALRLGGFAGSDPRSEAA